MSNDTFTELDFAKSGEREKAGMVDRLLAGEVIVARHSLQDFGLFDVLVNATLEGIRKSVGEEAARRAQAEGFHRIHEWVAPTDIPAMTDAVYAAVAPLAPEFLRTFVKGAFPDADTLYYEEKPNVRFHIPYDLARAHNKAFRDFAKTYGEGKIAAHGPHRDSWLDCPSNGVNLWFAIGPVREGNGLTVYARDYGRTFKYKRSGDIADGEKLHAPYAFDLQPGDGVFFHTDQVHGSELNRTDETRFVISFRMTFGKPHFPNKHYHPYVHSGWVESPLKSVATVPALMQFSYARSLLERAWAKVSPPAADAPAAPMEKIGVERDGKFYVPLSEAPVGSVRGVTDTLCVGRISETAVIAVNRRCPHSGGDFANGWVNASGAIVCPWHNLPFDSQTGQSSCKSLPPLVRASARIVGDEIEIDPAPVRATAAANA